MSNGTFESIAPATTTGTEDDDDDRAATVTVRSCPVLTGLGRIAVAVRCADSVRDGEPPLGCAATYPRRRTGISEVIC